MTHDFDENNCCTRCGATLTLRPDALVYTRECTDAPNVIAISHLRARKIAEESRKRASTMAVSQELIEWWATHRNKLAEKYRAQNPAVSIGPNGHFVFGTEPA